MSDMLDTLKELLGDNADEKLDGIMKIINPDGNSAPDSESSPPQPASDTGEISTEMLMMIQSLMTKMKSGGDDDRTRLLKSLKPYMSDERKGTIDSAIKMLTLSQFGELFKGVI